MSSCPGKDGGVLSLEKGVRLAHLLALFSTGQFPRVKALLLCCRQMFDAQGMTRDNSFECAVVSPDWPMLIKPAY